MIYLYGGIGACLLILGGLLWWRGHEIDRLKADIVQLHADAQHLTQANIDQSDTIDRQREALAKWVAWGKEQETKVAKAVAEVVHAQLARDKANATMLEMDQKERAKAECAAVLNQDLSASCPDIAHNIQERAK